MIVNCIAIIGIGICIGENLLLGIGIGSVVIFLYRWNPSLISTGDDSTFLPRDECKESGVNPIKNFTTKEK